MREYGFVRTRRAVYRLFGRHHPPGQVLLLLRYYWSAGMWRKPPVFAAEVIAGDILDRYDLPCARSSTTASLLVPVRRIRARTPSTSTR